MKNNFNKKLKWILFEKGLTQAELGEKMDLDQSRISKWMRGELTPSLENLEKIAKALDMSAGELIDYEPNKKKSTDKDMLAVRNEEIKVLREENKFLKKKLNLWKQKSKN